MLPTVPAMCSEEVEAEAAIARILTRSIRHGWHWKRIIYFKCLSAHNRLLTWCNRSIPGDSTQGHKSRTTSLQDWRRSPQYESQDSLGSHSYAVRPPAAHKREGDPRNVRLIPATLLPERDVRRVRCDSGEVASFLRSSDVLPRRAICAEIDISGRCAVWCTAAMTPQERRDRVVDEGRSLPDRRPCSVNVCGDGPVLLPLPPHTDRLSLRADPCFCYGHNAADIWKHL